jgi:hypothetical protein
MFRSSTVRTAAIAVAALVALALLRYKPWQHSGGSAGARPMLTVGFLPVT